jgi:hypothetical protein
VSVSILVDCKREINVIIMTLYRCRVTVGRWKMYCIKKARSKGRRVIYRGGEALYKPGVIH